MTTEDNTTTIEAWNGEQPTEDQISEGDELEVRYASVQQCMLMTDTFTIETLFSDWEGNVEYLELERDGTVYEVHLGGDDPMLFGRDRRGKVYDLGRMDELYVEADEPEIVTDGGEDVTDHVEDETVEKAIEDHIGPMDHELTPSVETVREAVAWVQTGIEEVWSDWLSNVEHNESDVVYEDSDVIVFATGEHNVPRRDLRNHYEGELPERVPDVVSAIHHDIARELTDYDWGYEYPLVVRKPESFDAGQQYVEAVVNGLQKRGLSPGQAWAYYGVEIRDNSRNQWGIRKGDHDHKNVSDALEKAKQKLP